MGNEMKTGLNKADKWRWVYPAAVLVIGLLIILTCILYLSQVLAFCRTFK